MSITLSSSKAAYLDRVAEGLADLPAEDREEVVQDLEAHLAELDDDEVETILGSPESFVAEFRQSAGLDNDHPAPGLLVTARARADAWATRLSEITHWPSIRPFWIWIRGWMLVTAWALLYYQDPFTHFPIPRFGSSSLTGLALVAGATWLSIWLDKWRDLSRPGIHLPTAGSFLFSLTAGLGLMATLVNTPSHYVEPTVEFWFDRLVTADGTPVENIYAYDLDGNPVDVLLFDQAGRPLLSLPPYVYEEVEYDPGASVIQYDSGTVSFDRDRFGRIIPNLYPLQLSRYDEYGRLTEVPPPSLGFPTIEEDETPVDDNPVPTTTAPPFG